MNLVNISLLPSDHLDAKRPPKDSGFLYTMVNLKGKMKGKFFGVLSSDSWLRR